MVTGVGSSSYITDMCLPDSATCKLKIHAYKIYQPDFYKYYNVAAMRVDLRDAIIAFLVLYTMLIQL